MIDFFTKLLILTSAIGAVAFVVAYHIFTSWWKKEMGRHVMMFMAVVALLATVAVLSTLFGPNYPGRDYVRFGCWALVNWIIWWRGALFVKVRFRERKKAESEL